MIGRALRLLGLAFVRPLECWDRLAAFVDVRLDARRERPDYAPRPWDEAAAEVGRAFGADASAILREPALQQLEEDLRPRIEELRPHAPYPLVACGDAGLGRFCYLVCRARRPAIVIETGVLYGVTSSFVLKALDVNGAGALHSIDLPPLRRDQERYVGCLIPDGLRGRWRLHRGTSRRVMPGLLAAVGAVDVFVHDSLHTYPNMRREFEAAAVRLSARGVVVSDDVHLNAAWRDWAQWPELALALTVRESDKPGLFGVGMRC